MYWLKPQINTLKKLLFNISQTTIIIRAEQPIRGKNAMVDESKQIPYEIIQHLNGEDLIGLSYEQLMPLAEPHQVLIMHLKLFTEILYRLMTEQVLFILHLLLVQMMQRLQKKLVCLLCLS